MQTCCFLFHASDFKGLLFWRLVASSGVILEIIFSFWGRTDDVDETEVSSCSFSGTFLVCIRHVRALPPSSSSSSSSSVPDWSLSFSVTFLSSASFTSISAAPDPEHQQSLNGLKAQEQCEELNQVQQRPGRVSGLHDKGPAALTLTRASTCFVWRELLCWSYLICEINRWCFPWWRWTSLLSELRWRLRGRWQKQLIE